MSGLFLVLVLICPAFTSCYDLQEVTAGADVTLKCVRVSGDIRLLEWTRQDIRDQSVFYYRNHQVKESYIDPRFHGRVMLREPQTADIVLHNVTVSDGGVYECWVEEKENQRKKRDATPNRVIKLTVTEGDRGGDGGIRDGGIRDGGIRDGGSRSHAGVTAVVAVVGVVFVVAAVAAVLVVRRKKCDSEGYQQTNI